MNLEGLIRMIVNTALRRIVNTGVNKGIDYAARGGKPKTEMSREERERARAGKANAQRLRRGLQIFRRFRR
ncbi:MAG: hypothetical protein R3D84_06545 [Paracoccaceae bacterium]